ncbi:MAG: SH3 domain-containing protein [Coriobacteriia bacterium]
MRLGERIARGGVGVVVVAIIFLTVMNWVGDYRSESAANGAGSIDASGTPNATATPSATLPATKPKASAPEEPSATPVSGKTVTVLVDGLNFRSAASKDAELIRGLSANEKLDLIAQEGSWLQVKDSQGTIGYVSGSGSYTRID